jgi:hypothetical protein
MTINRAGFASQLGFEARATAQASPRFSNFRTNFPEFNDPPFRAKAKYVGFIRRIFANTHCAERTFRIMLQIMQSQRARYLPPGRWQ